MSATAPRPKVRLPSPSDGNFYTERERSERCVILPAGRTQRRKRATTRAMARSIFTCNLPARMPVPARP